MDKDTFIAAITVYAEADPYNEDDALKVAYVIVNRGIYKNAPLSIICTAPWQFSCWNWRIKKNLSKEDIASKNRMTNFFANLMTLEPKPDIKDEWFLKCVNFIRYATINKELKDPTKGADHYFASYIPAPSWVKGKTPVATSAFLTPSKSGAIYGHFFYKLGEFNTPQGISKPIKSKRYTGAIVTAAAGTAASITEPGQTSIEALIGTVESVKTLQTQVGSIAQNLQEKGEAIHAITQKIIEQQEKMHNITLAFGFSVMVIIGLLCYMVWTKIKDKKKEEGIEPFSCWGI